MTKQKSTNLAYVVAYEDNSNSNENIKWMAQHDNDRQVGGQESGG
jgi:hypothetical protein